MQIIAYARTHETREVIERNPVTAPTTRFVKHPDELSGVGSDAPNRMLLWECVGVSESDVATLAHVYDNLRPTPHLLVRLDLANAGAHMVLELARHLPFARVSLRGVDDLVRDVTGATGRADEMGCQLEIARRVLPRVPEAVSSLVAVACLAGHRRLPITAFARGCGIAPRTLEVRLERTGIVAPRELVAWMVALHSLWRLEIARWPAKHVAAASGFTSTEAWSNYVLRHTGARPKSLLAHGGFRRLVERTYSVLAASRDPEKGPVSTDQRCFSPPSS